MISHFHAGQNLALGQLDWQAEVDDWYREISDFSYGSDANLLSEVGHFTQVSIAFNYYITAVELNLPNKI